MSADGLNAQLLRVLQGFMSETAARLVLRGTLESLKLTTPATEDLLRVIEALEPASRHFMHPAQRPRLAAELKDLIGAGPAPRPAAPMARAVTPAAPMPALGGPGLTLTTRPTTLVVRTEADASTARLTARTLCEELGGKGFECQKVATAVSELARNQISYAGGGTIHISPERSPRRMLRVRAEDQGQGIPNVELVLSGNYRSKTGMGLGLLGVKRLADRFDVRTSATGTQVEFEVWL